MSRRWPTPLLPGWLPTPSRCACSWAGCGSPPTSTRALARRGHPLAFDALWLSSYGEGRQSAGGCEVRAGLQRPVAGRQVLVLDDVANSGVSLAQAVALVREAGAREVLTAVFARKPWPGRAMEPDFVAWEAPARFLVGYGMDLAGAARGLPFVGAVD